jgi:hypothetical protein
MKNILIIILSIICLSVNGQNLFHTKLIYTNEVKQSVTIIKQYDTDSTFTMYFLSDSFQFKVVKNLWFYKRIDDNYYLFFDKNQIDSSITYYEPKLTANNKLLEVELEVKFSKKLFRDNMEYYLLYFYQQYSQKLLSAYEFSPIIGFLRLGLYNKDFDFFLSAIEVYENGYLVKIYDLQSYLKEFYKSDR